MRRQHALLALLLAACGDAAPRAAPPLATVSTLQARQQAGRSVDGSRRSALVTAVTRLSPSVVSISTQGRRGPGELSPFESFFGSGQEQVVQGIGTGFVVQRDGVIITNQHVVQHADKITVTLADGTELAARLEGEDATTDIAVLRVDRRNLPVAPIGRSTDLMIGEWVIALGNPYRFLLSNAEPTVTAGVVSATGRNILPTGEQPGLYLDMIQTDAAINPGNSGGPLANALGEVIGVNSSIFSNTGGSVGLGFAIPIERALRVTSEVLKRGEMRRAYVGLEVEGRGQLRTARAPALTVASVDPEGPAGRAGLDRGDVLVRANGRELHNWLDWEAVKLDLAVGDSVTVEVRSGERTERRRIVTRDLPSVSAEKVTVLRDLELVTVTPAIRTERRLATDRGALLFRISSEGSRQTGLQEGDVIVAINNTRIASADEVGEALERLRSSRGFRLFFERGRRILFTDLYF
ncbi:MAG: trypsin-like peptidase domain-containing protein [Gemmatimonadales bacterium]|nr:trypsin-like peptidase domain-containing protein [Gemmatimonadales bacterium]